MIRAALIDGAPTANPSSFHLYPEDWLESRCIAHRSRADNPISIARRLWPIPQESANFYRINGDWQAACGTVRRTRRVVFDFRRNSWLEWASRARGQKRESERISLVTRRGMSSQFPFSDTGDIGEGDGTIYNGR